MRAHFRAIITIITIITITTIINRGNNMKLKEKVCVHCGFSHKTPPPVTKNLIANTEYDKWVCVQCLGTMNTEVVIEKALTPAEKAAITRAKNKAKVKVHVPAESDDE